MQRQYDEQTERTRLALYREIKARYGLSWEEQRVLTGMKVGHDRLRVIGQHEELTLAYREGCVQ